MTPQRTTFAILSSSLAALLVLVATGRALAQEKDKLNKIADAIQKGDLVAAKKQASAYAKDHADNEELMAAFKLVTKGGLGVGGQSGIEKTLNDLEKAPPAAAALKAKSAELARMAEHVTAIGFISETLGITIPVKKGVPYTKLSNDLVAAAQEFKKAVDAQNPAAVQKTAKLVNQACLTCHGAYR